MVDQKGILIDIYSNNWIFKKGFVMHIAALVSSFRSPLLAGLVAGTVGLLVSQPAAAIPDNTLVIPFKSGTVDLSFGGGAATDVIGTNFDTTLLTATRSATLSSVNLQLIFRTQYDNASTTARYADVFIRIPGGTGSGLFTYFPPYVAPEPDQRSFEVW